MNDIRSVAVGLSGGVDSAVAAALLARSGLRVSGLTMKIWSGRHAIVEGARHACYGPGEDEDIAACRAICERLGIPYQTVDLSEEYESLVVGYFRSEYLEGRTPNPCVRCNAELKFGFLVERARAAGLEFDAFATGHYARIRERDGVPLLATAAYTPKDQTYFLWRLAPKTLERTLFPLGDLDKESVRAEARALGLEVADKPESQDFVAGGDYAPLFAGLGVEPGEIVDEGGKVLGRHRGIVHYTIGQRRGLGASLGPEPRYVVALDAERNRVVVSADARLFAEGLEAGSVLIHAPDLADKPFEALVRIRQNHRPAKALIEPERGRARVSFETPQRAVAPGQSAVFYSEDGLVLGGGLIERPLRGGEEPR